jgi:hypothetical protein
LICGNDKPIGARAATLRAIYRNNKPVFNPIARTITGASAS